MRIKIIAEAAQGYEGKVEYCDLYVRAAAKAGATAVKFQIVYADDTAEPGYQHYEFFKTLEMGVPIWQRIRALAADLDILFFTDVSGERAMEVARAITPDGIKIHSSNFFNRSLIKQAFETADRVFVSLGGVEEQEIRELIEDMTAWGGIEKLALLYGFQAEPTPLEWSNLNRLQLLGQTFPGIEIGYMDHTAGDSPDRVHLSLMAMTLGAGWIEKHITLSRFLEIEDYVSALEPDEFADYVATLARMETVFGPRTLALNDLERDYRDKSVKKLLAATDISANSILGPEDILFKRTPRIAPFEGFHDPAEVVGRTTSVSVKAGDPILKECLK